MKGTGTKSKFQTVSILGLALALGACGNMKKSATQDEIGYDSNGPLHQNDTLLNSTPNPSPSPGSDASPSPAPINTLPAFDYPISVVGYNSFTISVSTRTILKVRFEPGPNTLPVSGTNIYPAYTQLAVFISVGSTEHATSLLSNGVDGQTVQQSQIFDFSTSFTKTCPSTDTACRQNVQVTITKPNYNYWACNYGMYCFYPQGAAPYCTDHTHVEDSHQWTGTLHVQTDDTQAL